MLLATVYGCRMVRSYKKRRGELENVIFKGISKILEEGAKGPEGQPCIMFKGEIEKQTIRAYRPNATDTDRELPEVWVIITLPKGVDKTWVLPGGKSQVQMGNRGKAVVLTPFPWELNEKHHFKILRVPDHLTKKEVQEVIWKLLSERLKGPPALRKVQDRNGETQWNAEMTFAAEKVEGVDESEEGSGTVMGTIPMN